MPITTSRWTRIAGLLISLACIAWIVARFLRGGALDVMASATLDAASLIQMLLGGALVYAAAMCLPAVAWWRLVVHLAPAAAPAMPTIATYAVSQYGKYLPGNFAHYALRHAWSRRYGIPHASLGLASALEAALLLLSAIAIAIAGGGDALGHLAAIDPRWFAIGIVIALLALWIALAWIRRTSMFDRMHVPRLSISMIAVCTCCYVGFFLIGAGVLWTMAHVLAYPDVRFRLLLAAGAASWVAGFIVIGAPAGLGVREAAFVALMATTIGPDRALLLVGLFRVVTFLGDSLVFAAGLALTRRRRRP